MPQVQWGITCQQLIQAIVNRMLLLRSCFRLRVNGGRVVCGLGRRHGSRPPQREEEVLDGRVGLEVGVPERRLPVGRGLVLNAPEDLDLTP